MTAAEIAAQFRRMADLVERNDGAGFGGAFVVVPPENGGSPFDQLFVTVQQDAGDFWSLLSARCKAEMARVDQLQRQGQGYR